MLSTKFHQLVLSAAVLLGAATSGLAAPPVAAPATSVAIPAQPLSQALTTFARESGLQVAYVSNVARGVWSPGAPGNLTPRETLEKLLDGTGLKFEFTNPTTVTIFKPASLRGAESNASQEEGKNNSSRDFRVAQVAQGAGEGASAVAATAPSAKRRREAISPAPAMLGEVVVTALYRRQRAQDVPAAVSVLEGSSLRAEGARDYQDYLNTVPGVDYAESGLGAMSITIRGVSDGVAATTPVTAMYLDEAPITENYVGTFDPDIYDVQRVEVLEGPQGTLYGASSMGGTIRVITNKPQLNVFDANAELTGGSVAHGGVSKEAEGMVNLPLVQDRMAFRLAGGYQDDAGWIDDVFNGEKNGNTIEKRNAHAQLLLQPGPETKITLGLLYQNEDDGLPAWHDMALPDYETNRPFSGSGNISTKIYSLTIEQNWDWMSLVSATTYMKKNTFVAGDATRAIAPIVQLFEHVTLGPTEGIGVDSLDDFTSFSQEVRLQSEGKNRVDWLIGAFLWDATTDFNTVFDMSQAPSVLAVTTGPGFYDSEEPYRTDQIAAFGELTYHLLPKLSVTAGLRESNYKIDNTSSSSGALNGGTSVTQRTDQKSALTQKYLVKYQATPDSMLYAQAAEGFRVGGPNSVVPVGACGSYLAALGYSSEPLSYGPDKLWDYEVGSKNTLAHGAVTLNGDAYYIDWKDMQTAVGLQCGFGFTANAGEAVSKGAELQAAVHPVRGLTLSAGGSYVDASITQAAGGTPFRAGDPLPLGAKWSGNLGGQYDYPLPDDLDAFIGGGLNYIGSRWDTFSNTSGAVLMGGYATLNARLGVSAGHWTVSLFGNNLTDRHIVMWQSYTAPLYQVEGRPREIGVQLRVSR